MPGRHKPENTKTYDRRVGALIRKAAKEAGTTQTSLAKALGLSQGNISRIISGTYSASPEQLDKIGKVLNVDPRTFIPVDGDEEWTPPEPPHPFAEEPKDLPPGLAEWLERYEVSRKVTKQEKWHLVRSRFRLAPWLIQDDAFWAQLHAFWRQYLKDQEQSGQTQPK